MRVAARTLETRDGCRFVVRSARPAEAGRVLDHAWALHREEPQLAFEEADEFSLGVERLRAQIEHLERADNGFFLVAESKGRVAATLSVAGGRLRRTRHVGEIGLSVAAPWRRRGVGRALLEIAIEAARQSGVLRRLTLQVFATNEAALALYATAGFAVDGRRPGHVRLNGRDVDLVFMSRPV